jgi:hypothetical protein
VTLLKYLSPQSRRNRLSDAHHLDELCWAWRAGPGAPPASAPACAPWSTPPAGQPSRCRPSSTSPSARPPCSSPSCCRDQILADVHAVARRLSGSLGVVALRVESPGCGISASSVSPTTHSLALWPRVSGDLAPAPGDPRPRRTGPPGLRCIGGLGLSDRAGRVRVRVVHRRLRAVGPAGAAVGPAGARSGRVLTASVDDDAGLSSRR